MSFNLENIKIFLTNLVLSGRLMRLPVAVAGRLPVAVAGRGGSGIVKATPPLALWYSSRINVEWVREQYSV